MSWQRIFVSLRQIILLLALLGTALQAQATTPVWNDGERALLSLLSLSSLPELPADSSNRHADNPAAVTFGHQLFFDTRLSANGEVSCATCHQPAKAFTDGLALGEAIGQTARSTPSIIGIAYSSWFFWDGRSDSLWSQALGPLESAVEHGGNRMQYARVIHNDPAYRTTYESLFGVMPDLSDRKRFPSTASPVGSSKAKTDWKNMSTSDRQAINRIYANIGKAIAAYERRLLPGPSRFDRYAENILANKPPGTAGTLTMDEIAGLKLFIGKAMCITCHQGPLFTNHEFHNVGTPDPSAKKPDYIPGFIWLLMDKPEPDQGRYRGVQLVQASEFNCLGDYSDAAEHECAELTYVNNDHRMTLGAFKVPSLRNVGRTAPYMHSGAFTNLMDVLNHYNTAPGAPIGHSELVPLGLNGRELTQLEAFLHSLNSPVNASPELLQPPASRTTYRD